MPHVPGRRGRRPARAAAAGTPRAAARGTSRDGRVRGFVRRV